MELIEHDSGRYVVIGSTGEYEDYNEWPVAAFSRKGRAETWAKRANQWAKDYGVAGPHASYEAREFAQGVGNPYDKAMDWIDYTGVEYRVRRVNHVPLDPALPTKSLTR